MPKFLLEVEINCGFTYEVEAATLEEAHQIMHAAAVQHLEEGCDGVEVTEGEDSEWVDLGVRIGKDSTGQPYPVPVSSGLEFYERG